MRSTVVSPLVLGAVLLGPIPFAHAQLRLPASKCLSDKIQCVGRYVAAFANCSSKAARKTGTIDGICTGRAASKLATGAAGCLDKAAFNTDCTTNGSQAVALQGAADQFIQDALVAIASDHDRYIDNGDGTVTDSSTGLQWEQKTTAVGSGQNFADPHDVDNKYTWSAALPGTAADGTAFTQFLAALNTPPCFTGHCDWRLPSEEGLNSPHTGAREWDGILDLACGIERCLDPIFWPTAPNSVYWSSTTSENSTSFAFVPHPDSGVVIQTGPKLTAFSVRAVRTGP
jgi:hypothetical protein